MTQADERNWPTGTVTFLMTDVVDSSALAEREPSRYLNLLARHDRLAHDIVAAHGGRIVKHRGEGDSIFAAFPQAEPGARASADLVCRASDELGLLLRAALHCGAATFDEGDYRGDTVNRCGRLRSLAAPGQVLLSGAVASLLSSTQVSPLGSVHLRGLVRPIDLYILVAHGLNCDAPMNLASRNGNIARPDSPILGRTADLQSLEIGFSRARTVQLVGPGGVGKTRLALEYGYRCGKGAWFVDLTLAETPPIEGTILHELGLAAPGQRDHAAIVAESLSNASLLILDNCEHVPKDVSAFVRRVRRLAPLLPILLTTHQHLPIPGSATIPLRPLGTEGADAAAIRLMRTLAEAKAVDLIGTDDEITDLCRDLDGLPLALELVVPRLRTVSVAAARTRLARWLQRQESGKISTRHTSLGSLVAYSLGRLTSSERDLLEGLVPFVGGFTLGHAEAISSCDPDDVERDFSSLLENSMISPSDVGAHRFRFLSAIREGCLARSDENQQRETRSRSFVRWATQYASEALRTGSPFEAVRAESANLDAAFEEALLLGHVSDAAVVARALRKMHLHDFDVRAGRSLYERLSSRICDLSDEDAADALNALGIFRVQQSDFVSGREALSAANRLFVLRGDRERELATLHNLAICASDQGRFDDAIHFGIQAVQGYAEAENLPRTADAALTLANAYVLSNRPAEASSAAEFLRSLAESGERSLEWAHLVTQAMWASLHDDPEAAIRSLSCVTDEADERDLAFGLLIIASLLKSGDLAWECQASFEAFISRKGILPSRFDLELIKRVEAQADTGVTTREDAVEPRYLWSRAVVALCDVRAS